MVPVVEHRCKCEGKCEALSSKSSATKNNKNKLNMVAMLVVPVIWEAEVGGLRSKAGPGKKA
jgi:hypothetical protein